MDRKYIFTRIEATGSEIITVTSPMYPLKLLAIYAMAEDVHALSAEQQITVEWDEHPMSAYPPEWAEHNDPVSRVFTRWDIHELTDDASSTSDNLDDVLEGKFMLWLEEHYPDQKFDGYMRPIPKPTEGERFLTDMLDRGATVIDASGVHTAAGRPTLYDVIDTYGDSVIFEGHSQHECERWVANQYALDRYEIELHPWKAQPVCTDHGPTFTCDKCKEKN